MYEEKQGIIGDEKLSNILLRGHSTPRPVKTGFIFLYLFTYFHDSFTSYVVLSKFEEIYQSLNTLNEAHFNQGRLVSLITAACKFHR